MGIDETLWFNDDRMLCRTCGTFELQIAISRAEGDPVAEAEYRDCLGLHVGLDHVPRQRDASE